MVAWSKLALDYNCYDVGHTWSPSCSAAAMETLISCFTYSMKIYTTVYVLAFLLRCKRLTWATAKKMFLEILQSSCFLSWNGFAFVASICLFRRAFGRFYWINAGLLPGVLSSTTAILLERKSRRRLLAVYMLNVMFDGLYRMAVYRKYFTPIPNGEVYLFSISIAGFLYLYRKRIDLHDITGKLLSFLLGKEEGGSSPKHIPSEWDSQMKAKDPPKKSMTKIDYLLLGTRKYWKPLKALSDAVLNQLKMGPKHALCLHKNSCHYYWLQALAKSFVLGYSAQTALGIVSSLPKIITNPRLLRKHIFKDKSFKFGAFLGSFCAIFKMLNCLLRWLRDKDDARHGLIAGLIAGSTMLIYPMPSVALYIFCKLLEVLYLKGIETGYCPDVPAGAVILYTIACTFMFHVAVLEPHNLRPNYWIFLQRLTATKMGKINRQLLEPFGTDSGLMFQDVVYKYSHPHLTSELFRKTMQIT